MKPFFSYLGSKSKLAEQYPKPSNDIIIEPFCGSAAYSLLHYQKDVRLSDINPSVITAWEYLLNASSKDILSLPILKPKEHIQGYNLSEGERALIGFNLCRGKSQPRKTGHGFNSWTEKRRQYIAENLHKIKHWKIQLMDYSEIPNEIATYFIDPPYEKVQQTTSEKYSHWRIDYSKLKDWCLSRRGEIIVCENADAEWLPFKYFRASGANFYGKINYESIYHETNLNLI